MPRETQKKINSKEVRLDVDAPVRFGMLILLIFFGAGVGTAALAKLDRGISMPGTVIVETKVKPVQHERGGTVDAVYVREDHTVDAGDLLLTINTRSLDEQIEALIAQEEAARKQLRLAREEAATMNGLLKRKLAARSRVLAVERLVAEVEKEVASLGARIAFTKEQRRRAEVRAPVAGRVLTMKVRAAGAVAQPGATLLEIVPLNDRLVIEGRLSPDRVHTVSPKMPAKVWLSALNWQDRRPLAARLKWVSADSVEDKRTGRRHFLARIELEDSRSEISRYISLHPGMRAEVLLVTGKTTIMDRLVDPVMRNLNRAFRG